jgi:serine/threonine protein kinase
MPPPLTAHENLAPRPRAGQLVAGKYLLLTPLGAGGMGEVWAAENVTIGAEVAVKLVTPQMCARETIARLRREAEATAQLAHRSIVRVFDFVDLADGSPAAMIMERLRGETLGERLRRQGALSADAAVDVLVPILSALHVAHGRGIIHRDLKPENIFLHRETDGEILPKLLDFGVSKDLHSSDRPITHAGEVIGTPAFMSPEQARGEDVDARSDVYCAGIVLLACLTGCAALQTDQITLPRSRRARAKLARLPGASTAVWRVMERALRERADDRYGSAAELAEALARAVPENRAGLPDRGSLLKASTGACLAPFIAFSSHGRIVPARARERGLAGAAVFACIVAVSFGAIAGSWTAGHPLPPIHTEARAPQKAPLTVVDGHDVIAADESSQSARRAAAVRVSAATPRRAATHDAALHRDPYVIRDPGF